MSGELFTTIHAENIFMYSTTDRKQRNSIIISTKNCMFLIDPADDKVFLDRIKREADNRDLFILYSHSHPNHLRGARFLPYRKIYAHARLPQRLRTINEAIPLPTDVYHEEDTLELDGMTLNFYHLPGHLDDLTAVLFADLRIVYASDLLLENSLPFLGDGDIGQYLKSLEKFYEMDFTIILPGHGIKSEGNVLVDRNYFYLQKLLEYCKNAHDLEELRRIPISNFQNYPYQYIIPEFHDVNIKKVWDEFRG